MDIMGSAGGRVTHAARATTTTGVIMKVIERILVSC
jgi:hypothetical protein